jgi:hypothetical protein
MSNKKDMTKRQRLYYEYQNKDRVKEQLQEIAKTEKEIDTSELHRPYNPHENSYYS